MEKVITELDLEGSIKYFQVEKGKHNFPDERAKSVQESRRVTHP